MWMACEFVGIAAQGPCPLFGRITFKCRTGTDADMEPFSCEPGHDSKPDSVPTEIGGGFCRLKSPFVKEFPVCVFGEVVECSVGLTRETHFPNYRKCIVTGWYLVSWINRKIGWNSKIRRSRTDISLSCWHTKVWIHGNWPHLIYQNVLSHWLH